METLHKHVYCSQCVLDMGNPSHVVLAQVICAEHPEIQTLLTAMGGNFDTPASQLMLQLLLRKVPHCAVAEVMCTTLETERRA